MKKLGLAVGGLVLLIVIMSSSAATASGSSQFVQFHGSVCQPASGLVGYTQYGVHNTNPGFGGGSGSATVYCPMPLTVPVVAGVTVGGITLNYYDRGANGVRVTCTAQAVDAFGNVIYSEPKTSPTGGVGQGLQTFNFTSPSFDPGQNRLYVTCTIPPINGVWASHITGIQATVQLP